MRFAVALGLTLLAVALAAVPANASVRVALGDSYASGEGAGEYDVAGADCHRSARAWPRLLGVTAAEHFACSGASTANLLRVAQAPDARPQVASLEVVAASVFVETVFVTVGGNDLRFASKVRSCVFAVRACLRDSRRLSAELERARPSIAGTYRRIGDAVPLGRVVAVGYPEIAPDAGERDRCVWLSRAERRNIARYSRRLDSMLAAAASEAGVMFVSVRDALDGYELCTRRPWMVGIARPGTNWLADTEQGHPDRRGQQAIAELVRVRLAG